jgi:hypothetical protein
MRQLIEVERQAQRLVFENEVLRIRAELKNEDEVHGEVAANLGGSPWGVVTLL